MAKEPTKQIEEFKIVKIKKRRAKPQEFFKIMEQLKNIDEQIKTEEELYRLKMNQLNLEKEYLWSIIDPK